MRIRAHYYQQFDVDFARDVPAEGYGGWKQADIEMAPEHTAVVVMHAWDCGTREEFPGWHRAVEYLPRAEVICRTVFPPLLSAVRASPLQLIHVAGGGDYYQTMPGYRQTVALAGPTPQQAEQIAAAAALERLRQFRHENVLVGAHNAEDVRRGSARLDFLAEARPLGDEPIVDNSRQLFALCAARGINHLIYIGFAINWCLLLSPGGMAEMSQYGVMCSTIRQAVTAVENRETAREELGKELGLWRVALAFGFVFDLQDVLAALQGAG